MGGLKNYLPRLGSSHDPLDLCFPSSYVWVCLFVCLFSDGTEVWTHDLMIARQVFLCLSHSTSLQVTRIAGMRQIHSAKVIVHLVLHISRMYQSLLHSADKCSWMNEILLAFKCSSCTSPSVFSPHSLALHFFFLSQPLCLWHASITHRPRRNMQPAIPHTFILHNVLKPEH
jgi:hypothetical protein